jgi:hypothetical protein
MPGSSVFHPQFVFELLPEAQIVVSYQSATPPHPSEVHEYGALLSSLAEKPDVRCLWFTDGAHPTRSDQESLSQRVPKHQWRVALVSGSPQIRFIASAFSLVNRNLRYFTPEQLPQALRHLLCTREEQDAVQSVLAELRRAVEPPSDGKPKPRRRSEVPDQRFVRRT